MVYNVKVGIAAGAGLAGTALTTFSSSKFGSGSGGSPTSGNDKTSTYGHANGNNGCAAVRSSGSVIGNSGGGRGYGTNKNDETIRQMHMWKY